jgi:hypothetical protein
LKRAATVILLLVALAGCGRRDADAARRQRLAADRRGLEESLEQLEDRMLSDQARVRFWRELRERHERVSAVACTNLDRHAEAMAMLQDQQRHKRDALARKNRVAARFVAPADAAHDPAADER